jgi:hypothetical protein
VGSAMNLPILQKLKDGEKLDFATLADNVEQTEEYWEWWWDKSPGGCEETSGSAVRPCQCGYF